MGHGRCAACRAASLRSHYAWPVKGHDVNSLAVDLAGIPLRNPVLLAAGTAGMLDEMNDVLDLSRIGGVVTKSITAAARAGNATWRILESRTPGAMLNAIGLANPGIDTFLKETAPRAAALPCAVIASVAGNAVEDYVLVAGKLGEVTGIAAVELNVSCPNVHGGTEFGADPAALMELVRQVRRVLPRTRLLVKLSPITVGTPAAIKDLARAAIEPHSSSPGGPGARPGADALCISNTVPAMQIDVRTRTPRLSNVTGGLSGPAIHPIVVKLVHDAYRGVCKATGTPIIAIGGVLTWEDAAEFILAGATACAIGTALFADPRTPIKVAAGLEKWVKMQGAGALAELIGAVRLP